MSNRSESDLIAQAAADWLVQRDRGLDSRQLKEWQRWLQADPRHARMYEELDATWGMLGELGVRAVKPQKRNLMPWWPAGAGALAAAAAVAMTVWWNVPIPASPNFREAALTEVGMLRRMELPDGSILQLNASSEVEIEYTPEFRRARLLRGELHIEVAKNPTRPFIVTAGPVAVRAVGTAFDVRWASSQPVEVVVVEGKVRIDDSGSQQTLLTDGRAGEVPVLVAGQRARIRVALATGATAPSPAGPAAVSVLAPSEMAASQEWRTRQLQFVSVPLREIVDQFNRYNEHRILIGDPELAAQHFGGTFLAGDYQTFIRLLERNYSVRIERRAGVTTLYSK
jgi:transmembrane sensor